MLANFIIWGYRWSVDIGNDKATFFWGLLTAVFLGIGLYIWYVLFEIICNNILFWDMKTPFRRVFSCIKVSIRGCVIDSSGVITSLCTNHHQLCGSTSAARPSRGVS
jgi:hypothetical protein